MFGAAGTIGAMHGVRAERQRPHEVPVQRRTTSTGAGSDVRRTRFFAGHPGPADVLVLQPTVGNRAVAAVLFRQTVTGPQPISKDVPGLPDHVVVRVEEQLVSGTSLRAQAAIDLIVGVLAARGDIDLSLIEGRRMTFDPSLTDEGHTQQWGKQAPGGGFHPLPSTVRIGPPALTNVAWLYSTIIHENRHAEMFQTAQCDPFKEVDAYLHNIEHADEAGLDAGEVLELWGRLDDEWSQIGDALKVIYRDRYDAAKRTVRRLAGTAAVPAAGSR